MQWQHTWRRSVFELCRNGARNKFRAYLQSIRASNGFSWPVSQINRAGVEVWQIRLPTLCNLCVGRAVKTLSQFQWSGVAARVAFEQAAVFHGEMLMENIRGDG